MAFKMLKAIKTVFNFKFRIGVVINASKNKGLLITRL